MSTLVTVIENSMRTLWLLCLEFHGLANGTKDAGDTGQIT